MVSLWESENNSKSLVYIFINNKYWVLEILYIYYFSKREYNKNNKINNTNE